MISCKLFVTFSYRQHQLAVRSDAVEAPQSNKIVLDNQVGFPTVVEKVS